MASTPESAEQGRAAEEEVDAVVEGSFDGERFKAFIVKSCLEKLLPSDYHQLIQKGRQELASGQIQEAIRTFEMAMSNYDSPSLASFYLGKAYELSKALDKAEASYLNGLAYNESHRKCLLGLYEALKNQNKSMQAYDVLKKIGTSYTLPPQQLLTALRLAVSTRNILDIERYFDIYMTLGEPNDDVAKLLCPALVATGKHQIKNGEPGRGVELFHKAARASRGRPRWLKDIITTLIENNLIEAAEDLMRSLPENYRATPDFLVLEFLLMDQLTDGTFVIERGQELLQQVEDPAVYNVLIRRFRENGMSDQATRFIGEASRKWPDRSFS
jgi:tetratricopeptide (TPR) repeat protein